MCHILSLSKLIQWMKRWTNKKLINRLSVVNPICREDVGLFPPRPSRWCLKASDLVRLFVYISRSSQFFSWNFEFFPIFFCIRENLKEFGRILCWWASICRARWQSQSYRSYKVIEVFRKNKVFTLFTVKGKFVFSVVVNLTHDWLTWNFWLQFS